MHRTHLRKVGGSVMMVVPPVLLEMLQLQPGAQVGLTMEAGRLVVDPKPKPRYRLEELLAGCQPRKSRSKQDREWANDAPTGAELI